MRLTLTRLAAPLALASLVTAGACRDVSASNDLAARDALQKDLELAQASSVSLASGRRDLPPTRFVSALEAGERPSAGAGRAAHPSRRSPTRAPRARAEQATPSEAPAAVAQTVAAAASEPQPAPAPAPEIVATETASGPSQTESNNGPGDSGVLGAPNDGRGPSTDGPVITRRGRGRGLGGLLGGIAGVVIRGGGIGDDDHCERDHPGARRGGMPYPMDGAVIGSLPRSPVGGSRFPRM